MDAVSVPVCEEAHMVATWWVHGGEGDRASQLTTWLAGDKEKRGSGNKILFKSVLVSSVIMTHSRVT